MSRRGFCQKIGGGVQLYGIYLSLRLIVPTYSAGLIRVQRDSDNAQTDIYPDGSGDLDTASLLSFVGANNGYVVTWYNQTGQIGTDAIETSTVQAKIVNAGSLVTLNGKPSILFGSNTLRILDGSWNNGGGLADTTNIVSLYLVYQAPAAAASILNSAHGGWVMFQYLSASRTHIRNNSLSIITTGGYPTVAQHLISYNSTGSFLTEYWDGTFKISGSFDGKFARELYLGGPNVYMQEVQYILQDLTAENTAKMAEINTHYSIY